MVLRGYFPEAAAAIVAPSKSGGHAGKIDNDYWSDFLEDLHHIEGPIRQPRPSFHEAAVSNDAAIEASQVPVPVDTGELARHAERLRTLLLDVDAVIAADVERERKATLKETRRLMAIARAHIAVDQLRRRREAEDDEIVEILLMAA